MTEHLTSADIDETYVARPRTDVVAEDLDGETVIWDARDGALHILDQPATIVWQCLDGAVNVGQIARGLSDVFGVAIARMTGDVLEAVRSFGDQGLLEGVTGVSEDNEDTQPAEGSDVPGSEEPNHQPRFLPPPPGG